MTRMKLAKFMDLHALSSAVKVSNKLHNLAYKRQL